MFKEFKKTSFYKFWEGFCTVNTVYGILQSLIAAFIWLIIDTLCTWYKEGKLRLSNIISYFKTNNIEVIRLLRIYHLFILIVILFVLYIIIISIISGNIKISLSEILEYAFLLTPIIIIRFLVYVRLGSLYNISTIMIGRIVEIIGFQWYWVMERKDIYVNSNRLSYMNERNEIRLSNTMMLLRITGGSNDVIHSIYLPELCFKIDLIPGRLTTASLTLISLVNYGVCAEICGANHAFIPFKFTVVS